MNTGRQCENQCVLGIPAELDAAVATDEHGNSRIEGSANGAWVLEAHPQMMAGRG